MKTYQFYSFNSGEIIYNLEDALKSGISPDFAIVFASVRTDYQILLDKLYESGIPVIGASTCGEILFNDERNNILEESIILILAETKSKAFEIEFFEKTEENSYLAGLEAGKWGKNRFRNPIFLTLLSGLKSDGEKFIKGLKESATDEVKVFGGLAGDDSLFKETFVFYNNNSINNGAAVLLLDGDKFESDGISTSGWIGLGAEKKITRSEGNVVYTIDDEPAMEVYKKYLDIKDEDLPGIGVEYPLLVYRDNGTNVLRAVLQVNKENKSLIFAGTVEEGSTVKFSSSPGFEVIEQTKKEISLKWKSNNTAEIIFIFSCMARHLAMGPNIEEEIKIAYQLWQVPIAGFFTYGEIGVNYKGICDFHNETLALLLIKEK